MFSLTAYKTLELMIGLSYLRSVPTNNNTSASSTPVILEFIMYPDLKSGLTAKFPVPLISKLSELRPLNKSFNAKIDSQSCNSPIIAPIWSLGVFSNYLATVVMASYQLTSV